MHYLSKEETERKPPLGCRRLGEVGCGQSRLDNGHSANSEPGKELVALRAVRAADDQFVALAGGPLGHHLLVVDGA